MDITTEVTASTVGVEQPPEKERTVTTTNRGRKETITEEELLDRLQEFSLDDLKSLIEECDKEEQLFKQKRKQTEEDGITTDTPRILVQKVEQEERPMCPSAEACRSSDPQHWIFFQHTRYEYSFSSSSGSLRRAQRSGSFEKRRQPIYIPVGSSSSSSSASLPSSPVVDRKDNENKTNVNPLSHSSPTLSSSSTLSSPSSLPSTPTSYSARSSFSSLSPPSPSIPTFLSADNINSQHLSSSPTESSPLDSKRASRKVLSPNIRYFSRLANGVTGTIKKKGKDKHASGTVDETGAEVMSGRERITSSLRFRRASRTPAQRHGMVISSPNSVQHKVHVDFNYQWTTGDDDEHDVAEEFLILARLGQGASGKVYKAKHKPTGFVLAIKCIPVPQTFIEKNREEIYTLRKEIQALRRCTSLDIVTYYGVCFREASVWIMMEACEMGSVLDVLRFIKKKTMSEQDIAFILKHVINGLVYLHSINIVHRDLKPGNILLTADGRPKLADFGTSTHLQSSHQGANTVLGTPLYMSPETLKAETYGVKSDVWSLGITAIQMAEGNPPHWDKNVCRAMLSIIEQPAPKLKDPEAWSPEFQDFVQLCLCKDSSSRPEAADLLSHPFLSKVSGYLSPSALPPPPSSPVASPSTAHYELDIVKLYKAKKKELMTNGNQSGGGHHLFNHYGEGGMGVEAVALLDEEMGRSLSSSSSSTTSSTSSATTVSTTPKEVKRGTRALPDREVIRKILSREESSREMIRQRALLERRTREEREQQMKQRSIKRPKEENEEAEEPEEEKEEVKGDEPEKDTENNNRKKRERKLTSSSKKLRRAATTSPLEEQETKALKEEMDKMEQRMKEQEELITSLKAQLEEEKRKSERLQKEVVSLQQQLQ
ncbi:Serine/threonine-protein kinase [Balamuthia mandrillaris]